LVVVPIDVAPDSREIIVDRILRLSYNQIKKVGGLQRLTGG